MDATNPSSANGPILAMGFSGRVRVGLPLYKDAAIHGNNTVADDPELLAFGGNYS
jgi:hypothetical protein